MNTNTAYTQEKTKSVSPLININDFGKYLTYTSFQEVVHQVKTISLERIIANEPIPEYHIQPKAQTLAKTA
jgi:hypothetical protein